MRLEFVAEVEQRVGFAVVVGADCGAGGGEQIGVPAAREYEQVPQAFEFGDEDGDVGEGVVQASTDGVEIERSCHEGLGASFRSGTSGLVRCRRSAVARALLTRSSVRSASREMGRPSLAARCRASAVRAAAISSSSVGYRVRCFRRVRREGSGGRDSVRPRSACR